MNCLRKKSDHFSYIRITTSISMSSQNDFSQFFYTSVSSYLFSLSTCTFVEKMILTVNQFPERKSGRGKRMGAGFEFHVLSMGGGGHRIPLKAIQGAIHIKKK